MQWQPSKIGIKNYTGLDSIVFWSNQNKRDCQKHFKENRMKTFLLIYSTSFFIALIYCLQEHFDVVKSVMLQTDYTYIQAVKRSTSGDMAKTSTIPMIILFCIIPALNTFLALALLFQNSIIPFFRDLKMRKTTSYKRCKCYRKINKKKCRTCKGLGYKVRKYWSFI